MRVALLTYSTKPRGGVVHTLALAEALVANGAEVDVWTLGRGGDSTFFRQVDPRVRIWAVPFVPVDDEDVGTRIVRSIHVLSDAFEPQRGRYDIVHAQDCISANAAMPCVRTVHHLDQFTTPQLRACHERAVTEPLALICVSGAVAAEVADGWGLRPAVIANGVDADRFGFAAGPDGREARSRWRHKLGDYVLALGGIEPRKGSIELLEAFSLLSADSPGPQLVFAGGETLFDYRDYRADFEARAAQLGVDYQMLGVVDDEELPTLVAAASVLAFVSTKEGFGLAAMEALAAGVPVVARDLPVLREVFGDAVSYGTSPRGFAQLIRDAIESPPDPEPGRAVARSYSWDTAAQLHLDFYARRVRGQ